MTDRLTLAQPTDIFLDNYDATVTATQIQNNTVVGSPDDWDVLASIIEGAEDEYRQAVDLDTRTSREGTEEQPETWEHITYKIKGHEAFKRNFSRTGRDYAAREVTKSLDRGNILPFDPDEGDGARIYRGTRGASGDSWEDVTDERGELWDIVNPRDGVVAFHPIALHRAMLTGGHGVGLVNAQLEELRFAITYRYGGLGRTRSGVRHTELGEELTDTQTGTVGIDDGRALPAGPASEEVVLLIGTEYLTAEYDRDNDEMDVLERGVRGTNADSHETGDRVTYVSPAIRKAVAARSGMALVNSGRYSGWLPDSDDEITKADMLDGMRETWEAATGADS